MSRKPNKDTTPEGPGACRGQIWVDRPDTQLRTATEEDQKHIEAVKSNTRW